MYSKRRVSSGAIEGCSLSVDAREDWKRENYNNGNLEKRGFIVNINEDHLGWTGQECLDEICL